MLQSISLNTNGQALNSSPEVCHSTRVKPIPKSKQASGSFFIENNIVDDYGPNIGSTALAVYVILRRYCNRDRQCWPSLKRLAKQGGLSVPTVLKAMITLEREGLIMRQQRQSSQGDADTTLYTLMMIPSTGRYQHDIQGCAENKEEVINEVKDGSKRDLNKGTLLNNKRNGKEDPPEAPLTTLSVSQRSSRRRQSTSSSSMPLPHDFVITAAMWQWAEQSPDITTLDIQRATHEWVDAMHAHGKQYVDWVAAWQNGMRRAQKWADERNQRRDTIADKLEGRVSPKTARSMQNAVRAANQLKERFNDI